MADVPGDDRAADLVCADGSREGYVHGLRGGHRRRQQQQDERSRDHTRRPGKQKRSVSGIFHVVYLKTSETLSRSWVAGAIRPTPLDKIAGVLKVSRFNCRKVCGAPPSLYSCSSVISPRGSK